ncbi:MAG: hypothetical protein OHK0040_11090 [bacterium]
MERRLHKRVKLFVTARYGREGDTKSFFGSVVDVSYSGVFLMTSTTFTPGERIWIECTINGQSLKLSGTVARTKIVSHPQLVTYSKGGVGIKVDNMHPYIMNFIDERLKEEARFI